MTSALQACQLRKLVRYRRFWLFITLAMIGCLVDLATKSWAFAALGTPSPPGHERKIYWLVEPFAGFETSLNEGALFGIGQGLVLIFAALSVVATLAILYWLFVAGSAHDLVLTVTLACITAGILGNLYDRLALHGIRWQDAQRAGEPAHAVRDFILLQASPRWVWPNFNIADCLLVCGSVCLLWHGFREPTSPSLSGPARSPSS